MPKLVDEELIQLFVAIPVAVIVVVILLGIITSAGLTTGSAEVNATTTGYTTIDPTVNEIPAQVTVRATTGKALELDGASAVPGTISGDLANESWGVCASVELGESAGLNGTYDVIAYDNATVLLQYDAGEWSVYHNNGTHDGKATIEAPDPRTTGTGGFMGFLFGTEDEELRRVCGRYDATANELFVARDGNVSGPVPLTTATTTRNVSHIWEGRMDEARVFGPGVTNATLSAYGDDPVQPLPGPTRYARYMFDEGSGTTTTVYFANQEVSIGTGTWTSGADGPSLDRGTDYELGENPFSITIVSGGYLEGAPVEHVSWDGHYLPFGLENVLGPVLFVVIVWRLGKEASERL